MKRIQFLLFVTILFLAGILHADENPVEKKLQAHLDQIYQDNTRMPGVSLYVACPALDLDWEGASGKITRDSDSPLTPEHTFRIASNTKTYVAAAVLRLVEMNQLDLEDPLESHLPEQWAQWLNSDGYDLKTITIRMLLSHTAGLNDHSSDNRYADAILADPQRRWLPDDQIRLLTEWFDPLGQPGENYSYSDDDYILLGRILEIETGLPLGPAVSSLLDFESLGLNSTWWETMEAKPVGSGDRAHQYYEEFDTIDWDPSLDLYGGGGLLTDARDLGLFTRKLIKGKVLHTEKMLTEMTGGGTAAYRLGLICSDIGGYLAWGHTGFWNTFAYHFPALDLTVSGSIMSRPALFGDELAKSVVAIVEEAMTR